MALRDEVLELLRSDAAFREELRRQLLTEELLGLPALFRELAERVNQLAEAQRRTERQLQQLTERVDRLTERVDRLTERVDRLTERVDRLTERVEQLTEEMRELVRWQRGEAGRRDGERFERAIRQRAFNLFNGGRGGEPSESWVQERLAAQLEAVPRDGGLVSANEDPFLADLVWWKGEQVIVVETSLQVNGTDLARAAARAATLARAGARVVPVVVGEGWATPDTVRQAETLGVEWKVGSDLSPGLLALRRAS